MKKKIFIYTTFFFVLSFILYIINSKIEKKSIEKLTYQKSTVENFIFVSKNSRTIIISGKKLIDQKNILKGISVDTEIVKNGKKFNIKAKFVYYSPKNQKINLKENVNLISDQLNLSTETLDIDLKRNIAYNKTLNIIKSDKMITTGQNLFINMNEEIIKLTKVKTILKR